MQKRYKSELVSRRCFNITENQAKPIYRRIGEFFNRIFRRMESNSTITTDADEINEQNVIIARTSRPNAVPISSRSSIEIPEQSDDDGEATQAQETELEANAVSEQAQLLMETENINIDETKQAFILSLYPQGRVFQELLIELSGILSNPTKFIRNMVEEGHIQTQDGYCILTPLGIRNARAILMNILKLRGISAFYQSIKPYLDKDDEWAIDKYNSIVRNIVFENSDLLFMLITEKSLEELIMSVCELRGISDDDEKFIDSLRNLCIDLRALDLVVSRRVGDSDYLKVSESGKAILSKIINQLSSMFKGSYEIPKTEIEIKKQVTKQFFKKYIIASGIVETMICFIALLMTSDWYVTFYWATGGFVFLSFLFVYLLK